MAFNATLSIDPENRFAAALAKGGREFLTRLVPPVHEALLLLEREIKEEMPVATGISRDSVSAQEPEVLQDQVIGLVGSPLASVLYIEHGTAPHHPPIQPIMDWVKVKLGLTGIKQRQVAEAIAWKISHYGTKGQHAFEKAFSRNRGQVERILDAGVRAALKDAGLLQ